MNPLIYTFVAIQLFIVAWIDLRSKVISNYWHLLNLLLAITIYMTHFDLFKWDIFLFPVGYLLAGFMLFLFGIMGAGDSKYLAGLCLVIPLEFHLPFFEALLICTIMVGAMLIGYRVSKDFQKIQAYARSSYWQGLRGVIKSEFSYAPVIFLAWLFLGIRLWT